MNKINRKAVSLSLNAVIIGVLLMIVLAVVLIIFGGGMGKFSTGTECPQERCRETMDCSNVPGDIDGKGFYAVPMKCDLNAYTEGNYCCFPK